MSEDPVPYYLDIIPPIKTIDNDAMLIVAVKRQLRHIAIKGTSILEKIHYKHDEFNKQYFDNQLPIPLITIEKLHIKLLAAYQPGKNTLGIEGHIRFNRDFIRYNTWQRIFETLLHEMIHQWQDMLLYPSLNKGNPKNWHNKDFFKKASMVSLPANGKKASGSPSFMPESKKVSKKFHCGCHNARGRNITIWSTSTVKASCLLCGQDFIEVMLKY